MLLVAALYWYFEMAESLTIWMLWVAPLESTVKLVVEVVSSTGRVAPEL